MANSIEVARKQETESGWKFLVKVGEGNAQTQHSVALDKEYWEQITDGQQSVEELIRQSFVFLLAREANQSILREFNLREISTYFPSFESEMRGKLFEK